MCVCECVSVCVCVSREISVMKKCSACTTPTLCSSPGVHAVHGWMVCVCVCVCVCVSTCMMECVFINSHKFRLEDIEKARQMVELRWSVAKVSDAEVNPHPPTLTHPHIHQSPRLMQLHKHWSGAGEAKGEAKHHTHS